MIFHRKLILHFEAHRGYWPRLSVKLEPKPGRKVNDGGLEGTLMRCPECSGDGLLVLLEPQVQVLGDSKPAYHQHGQAVDVSWDGDFPGNPGGYPKDPWGR